MAPRTKKQFGVIGLGRFGQAIINGLIEANATIMAFDINPEKVQKVANLVSYSAVLDSTDEEQLKAAGISNCDHVVIAIGNDIQASIMTAAILTELNIPKITVKSNNQNLTRIFEKLGITDLVFPERDSGYRTAMRICHDTVDFRDYIELDENHAIIEIVINRKDLLDTPLQDLNLRVRFGINIIAIKRKKKVFIPEAKDVIKQGDSILFVGKDEDNDNFEDYVKQK
jgi:trk system potassium uptake protein TrkA